MKIPITVMLLLACGCKEDKVEPVKATITAVNELAEKSQLQAFFTVSRPSRPQGVANAVAARPAIGSEIAVTGRVAGSKKPIGDSASLMLAQTDLPNCVDAGRKDCPTPWDLCSNDLKGKVCTIQVKGGEGRLLRTSLRGLGGLKEMSVITISGKVSISDEGLLVIDAAQIFVDNP
ncbi:MAG: hypothetical protein RL095_1428 [Verrucomicrobiota bacterium]|jgi:hypothetical protein